MDKRVLLAVQHSMLDKAQQHGEWRDYPLFCVTGILGPWTRGGSCRFMAREVWIRSRAQSLSLDSDDKGTMSDIDEAAASNETDVPASSTKNDEATPTVPIQLEDNPAENRAEIYHTGWRFHVLTAR